MIFPKNLELVNGGMLINNTYTVGPMSRNSTNFCKLSGWQRIDPFI